MLQQTGTLLRRDRDVESGIRVPKIALQGHQVASRQPDARDRTYTPRRR